MATMNLSNFIETALTTCDSIVIFKQFLSKDQGSYKQEFDLLSQILEEIDYILRTNPNSDFQAYSSFWSSWFSALHQTFDQLADLLTKKIKKNKKSLDKNIHSQIQEYQQQFTALIDNYKIRSQTETVPWYIWVYTSNINEASTNAEVNLVLYGHNGKSDNIKLRSKSDVFEAGQCDEFKVDIVDVGTPFKLRVSYDDKKFFSPWHLDRIEMEDLKTKKRYKFHCGRWLSKLHDDKQVIRELPAEGPGISRPLPVVKYMVNVYTGKKTNAETDANVFINIFGECGDTGERPLEYSLKDGNKFERNKIDSFIIEAVSLKQIRKIRIGHDGSNPGAGWFLDKVVVHPEDQHYESATFGCNRWLAVDEDDGRLVRELTLTTTAQHLDKTTYNIRIKTGDIFQAGTDADVYLKIFGESGDTDKIQLRTANNTSNKFERGRTDHFTFEFDDLGKIEHIIIGHNAKNFEARWFLDWIEIDIPMRGELYRFVCNRWLDKNEGDGKIELDLIPSDIIKKSHVIPYEVTVFTGDKSGARTDADVFIQMYGLNGKTEEIILKNKSDLFERKSVDKFKIEAPDIGQIQKIRIGHNSEKFGSAWYLEKVLIQRHLSEQPEKRKRGFKSGRSQRLSQISATDPNVEEYWFVCQQWFDKSSGDKATVRELLPTDEKGNVLSDRQELTYVTHVFTGDKSGAGTDANVFLTIYGASEDTGERELRQSKTNRNKFERNQEDVFEIKAAALGKLKKIKIRHDDSNIGSAWYLDRVEITDPETNQLYHFVCQKWLATDKDDGLISREIPALENKALRLAAARESSARSSVDYGLEMKTIATTYKISVITSNEFGSGTNANVYIIIFGENNDTGKVPLVTSKTYSDPFDRDHTDVFEIEAMDIGEPKKIKIGHDDSGFRPDWLLERVEIDVPKFGRIWIFPCGKWLSTSKGDCQLEVELYPQSMATEAYKPYVPYEIKVFTSKVSGAGTDANVHIEIYGVEKTTGQVMLCGKTNRKGKFRTDSVDTFVLELEDVGKDIEKIRIGHDNRGFGASWHLDHVEIRRLDKNQKTKTFIFPCRRWLAKGEDDGSIVRDLLSEKGQLQVPERYDECPKTNNQVEVGDYLDETCDFNGNVRFHDQPFKHKTSEILEQTVEDVYKDIQESVSIPQTDSMIACMPTNHAGHSSRFSLSSSSSPSVEQSRAPMPLAQLTQSVPLDPKSGRKHVAIAHTNFCFGLCRRSQQNQSRATQSDQHHTSTSKQRLMISYNWDSQTICKKIYDRLQSDGYTVWFDVQNMHGCIYTAMAKAVEQSQIVLFGMTEKYRQSDNCRKELTYACKQRKRLIPLRLQEKYDPNGWLGLISAELLYIDFTKRDFDINYRNLLKEIESGENVV
ncbi:unnamed protein product [Rotaria sordida]|uniref:PLAT domain-containing protein n=1 Tax=Rotaria sordida TaxID=392033 RepID=A0A815CRV4_9BILA|nr:unnamed protein product [Rotaria sordida]